MTGEIKRTGPWGVGMEESHTHTHTVRRQILDEFEL